jgi:hypothetical protein
MPGGPSGPFGPNGPSGPFAPRDQERRMEAAKLLGLDNFINPTEPEVASARRKQISKYHPDKTDQTAEQNFVDMNKKLTDAANVFHKDKFSAFGSTRII